MGTGWDAAGGVLVVASLQIAPAAGAGAGGSGKLA